MAYKDNIPQAADILSSSQADLLENFSELDTQFAVNHYEFSDTTANIGKHRFVSLVEQSSDPTTADSEYAVYSKDSDGEPELFGRPQNNASAHQLTKDGSIYLGVVPHAAVNFSFSAAIQGSAFNVASVARQTAAGAGASDARYVITFTNPAPNNNYFWSASAVPKSGQIAVPMIQRVAYADAVKTTQLAIQFTNSGGTVLTDLTRVCCVIWRYQ